MLIALLGICTKEELEEEDDEVLTGDEVVAIRPAGQEPTCAARNLLTC